MISKLIILTALSMTALCAEELKVIADAFKGDQKKGISSFSGNVRLSKGKDELNASKLTIYTDAENKPTRYEADGDVSFYIVTENQEKYRGTAQKALYLPGENEYRFSNKVDLVRLDDYRRVRGDKVVVNMLHGQASAESAKDEPVIMIFTVDDKNSKSKSPSK
ncbi:MAG: lipopolysaccharide transport periplasmic protein LptA [Sulfuricurvum sp.]